MQRRDLDDEKSHNNILGISGGELIEILSQPLCKGTEGRTRKPSIKRAGNSMGFRIPHHAKKYPRNYCYRNVHIYSNTAVLKCRLTLHLRNQLVRV